MKPREQSPDILADILKSEGTMKDKAKLYNNFALLAGNAVYDRGLREYLRTVPGFWTASSKGWYG